MRLLLKPTLCSSISNQTSKSDRVLWMIGLGIAFFTISCTELRAPDDSPKIETIISGGRSRTCLVDVPDKLCPRAGLVLVFHGFGDSPESIRNYSGFLPYLQEGGFVFAYPQGIADSKGNKNFSVGYAFQDPNIDEVQYVQTLVESLVHKYRLDRRNVFVTGMSNGGDMSYYLARQPKPVVRAAAPIAGTMMASWDVNLRSRNRLPIMAVNGNADTVTRWEGDMANRDGWGAYHPIESVLAYWQANLRTGSTPTQTEIYPGYTKRVWDKQGKREELVHYTIHQGPHEWPRFITDPQRPLAMEILSFFKKHAVRPQAK